MSSWDDNKKKCVAESSTCPGPEPTTTESFEETSPTTKGLFPIYFVGEMRWTSEAYYPSYIFSLLFTNLKNWQILFFTKMAQICSDTHFEMYIFLEPIKCVDDCSDKPDGFYQSCKSCSSYVYCYWYVLKEKNCDSNL